MAYHIYLVDDDRFLTNLYAAKFKSDGHDITMFKNADELLAHLRKEEGSVPDAILIDLIMPGTDGFAAIEAIRKEGLAKGSRIIILSNESQEEEVERARSLGVQGYISKASAVPSEVLTEVLHVIQQSNP